MKMVTRNNASGKLKHCQGSLALDHNQVHRQMGLWRALLKGKGHGEVPVTCHDMSAGKTRVGHLPSENPFIRLC